MARSISFNQAVIEATAEEMRRDPTVYVIGTRVPKPLLEEFGADRVRRTPISESAIAGMAVGSAMGGLRPVVILGHVAFAYSAFDQITNQAAKLRYMFGGQCEIPVVFRVFSGFDPGMAAQHCQSPYSIFAQFPGLKVAVPSAPGEAKGLLKAAIRDPNPLVFFEPLSLLDVTESMADDVPAAVLGEARVLRRGSDATLLAIGAMVPVALEAAEKLAKDGVSVEVIDPRSLVPFDVESLRQSVRATGRLAVVDEAPAMCSMAAEIIALAVEDPKTLRALRSPPLRLCAAAAPVPFSRQLEAVVAPMDPERIVAAVRAMIAN